MWKKGKEPFPYPFAPRYVSAWRSLSVYILGANETEGRKNAEGGIDKGTYRWINTRCHPVIITATQFGHVCSLQTPSLPRLLPIKKRNNRPDKFPAGRAGRAIKCVTALFLTEREGAHPEKHLLRSSFCARSKSAIARTQRSRRISRHPWKS